MLGIDGVLIAKFVHVAGEDSCVRIADKEETKIEGAREDVNSVREGIIREVA